MDENKRMEALAVYNKFCEYLDRNDLKYDRIDEHLLISFAFSGEDLPMRFFVNVDPVFGIIRFISELPFQISEDKIIDFNLAVAAVNDSIINGNFIVSPDGKVLFKMVSSYYFDEIYDELFDYLLSVSVNTVEEFNDKFFALEKGFIPLNDFIKQLG